MTSVIIIQALFFQDGGIAALGANLFNIALVAPWIGYGIFKLFERWKSLRPISIFIAAWLSVTASAALVAIELFFSGIVPLGLALKAMLTWHSIIGVAEGIITVVVLRYVMERQSNQETFFAPGAEVVER
ncbi:energy-coupling factor ABC transporter permease [Ammoniphilus sp. CFH 90114]|uniref:energy-coupling factor ABC transporter permease n=1 Tax=Ammoniphilus sp. CFH 90114 TaxID=2493665 RepID=UPI001F0BFB31|nr:energy-coupling factor ABC transporter permease [Ammoniphilus sp. CFH 90114]